MEGIWRSSGSFTNDSQTVSPVQKGPLRNRGRNIGSGTPYKKSPQNNAYSGNGRLPGGGG